MGLDIYLYSKEHHENNVAYYEAWDKAYESVEHVQDYQKRHDAVEKLMENEPKRIGHVDIPSKEYPDHMFNRTYLRSSYNEGGYNSWIRRKVGEEFDLYGIFKDVSWIKEDEDPDYPGGWLDTNNLPELLVAKENAKATKEKISEVSPLDAFFVEATQSQHTNVTSAGQAILEVERQSELNSVFRSYSTHSGQYFLDGLEVVAVVQGTDPWIKTDLGHYIVYKSDQVAFYSEATDIIIEFIDQIIEYIERDGKAYISWSG